MLPRTAEYALRTVVWMARHPKAVHTSEGIAEATRVPRRYLYKVLQALVNAELALSRPGPQGGYRLSRLPRRISLLDVVAAVCPIERIRSCPLSLASHSRLCPLHRQLDQAYAACEKALKRVTVARVLREPELIPPLCDFGAPRGNRSNA